MHLSWKDVDFGRKRIILHETKNGERRAVPLAGQAFDILQSLEKKRRIDTNLIFPKFEAKVALNDGQAVSPLSLQKHEVDKVQKVQKPAQLRSPWISALKKAQIADFRFHDLRHCAASYFAMSGASLAEIADILGHKTLAMVKRYAHLSDSHKLDVVQRMNKSFLG